jgi:hypothetical protein
MPDGLQCLVARMEGAAGPYKQDGIKTRSVNTRVLEKPDLRHGPASKLGRKGGGLVRAGARSGLGVQVERCRVARQVHNIRRYQWRGDKTDRRASNFESSTTQSMGPALPNVGGAGVVQMRVHGIQCTLCAAAACAVLNLEPWKSTTTWCVCVCAWVE